MSAPEEIVCETEEGFREACQKYGAFRNEFSMDPRGEVAYGRVRIVYRPTTLSRCPRCGSSDRNTYIHSSMPPHDFHAPCFHDGDYHPWHAAKDVAPRDEAREAFEKWLSYDKEQHGVWDTAGMYRAFLAGLASVKP